MQTITPSAKWYQHITELPLNRFIDCLVDGNIYALVITGKPTDEELMTAWGNIQTEYADAIGNHEYRLYVNLFKEVTLLSVNLQLIMTAIEILEDVYSKELTGKLNKLLSSNITLDPADPEKYKSSLKRFDMRSKGLKIDLDLKQIQLKAMEAKINKPGDKPTREYYHSVLITLSDHAKYQIPDSITVFEFCDRMKRFVNYCEQAQRNKGGRR